MTSYDILWINGNISAIATSKNSKFNKLATLKASSKSSAIKTARIQIKNNLIKEPSNSRRKVNTPELKLQINLDRASKAPKKAIFCDFNGVLDNGSRSDECNINDKLAKETCPHKAFKLLTLAAKHDALIVMTSQHRILDAGYYRILKKSLKQSGIKEYVDFIDNNRHQIRKLCNTHPTGRGSSRRNEIIEYIDFEAFTHFVVFEDEHHIGEDLNAIMTNKHIGLTDSHIKKAGMILNAKL
jgi:hypothetical protein